MGKNAAIPVFDDAGVPDFAGPFEVFAVAELPRPDPALRVVRDHAPAECPQPRILAVPGGFGKRALPGNPVLMEWIRRKPRSPGAAMGVCAGAHPPAQAGIPDGLREATRHRCVDTLRQPAPGTACMEHERGH